MVWPQNPTLPRLRRPVALENRTARLCGRPKLPPAPSSRATLWCRLRPALNRSHNRNREGTIQVAIEVKRRPGKWGERGV